MDKPAQTLYEYILLESQLSGEVWIEVELFMKKKPRTEHLENNSWSKL
jgi:hypothetical protein